MIAKVKNREEILSNAESDEDQRAREIALDTIEKAIESVNPRNLIYSRVKVHGGNLIIDGNIFDLKSFNKIFVVGGGKASGYMAEAIEDILGERIEDGIIVVPRGSPKRFKTMVVKIHEASHPIPDESSVEGAKRIMEIAEKAGEEDLIICLISGGGSSLMAYPRDEISLEDKRKVTEILLKCGATISEINAVRKHLSKFKGGQLAKRAYPATLISLLLSDVVGDPLDVIASGPTVPDSSTFKDAINVLRKYGVWESVPDSVKNLLLKGEKGLIEETPKSGDACFKKTYNFIVGNNRDACLSAINEMRKAGLNALLLTSYAEGEARDIGLMVGAIAREIISSSNPVKRPAGVVIGGESTVTVIGGGIGGRNQEIALSSALSISGLRGVVIASTSTDGVDGPTDAAGAIVDGATIHRSKKLGLDAEKYLRNNDSYTFFKALGDLIYTGPTGTNVNDLTILVAL
ncbi:MAG: glycerate kinase [Candidatus Bathyarchaeota archaeon]|nr:glycerate kinase [Candidatus Bathyarchaeota archaeon]